MLIFIEVAREWDFVADNTDIAIFSIANCFLNPRIRGMRFYLSFKIFVNNLPSWHTLKIFCWIFKKLFKGE